MAIILGFTQFDADPEPFQTPVIEQLAPSPICVTPADIFPFAFMPDGTSILVRGSRRVQIYNLDVLKELSFLQAPKNIMTATLSPDGSVLATVPSDGPVALWSLDTGENIKDLGGTCGYDTSDAAPIIRTIERMQGPVWDFFFSPDSSSLAATDGIEIHIWRVRDGMLLYFGKATCP